MLIHHAQHYHSIQARGERVKDVLVAAKATVGDGSSAKHETTGNEVASSNASLDEGEVEEEDPSFDPAMASNLEPSVCLVPEVD